MYNNGYPVNYQPYQAYQAPMVQQPQTMQQPMQSFAPQIRRKADIVQGEMAANVYPVSEGEEVVLFDIDSPFVYKKKRGFDGRLETEKDVLTRYEEEQSHDNKIDLSGYVRREEMGQLMSDAITDVVENAVQRAMEQHFSDLQPKKAGRPKAED